MTLDARLDKLKAPEAANAALNANIDELLSNVPEPLESVQVAGIGTGIKKLVDVLIPKQAKEIPTPKKPPPAPESPQYVEKLITPQKAVEIKATVGAGEPAIAEGYVRLYRGQRGEHGAATDKDDAGRWFSTEKSAAEFYGSVSYVDVPKDVAAAAAKEQAEAVRLGAGGIYTRTGRLLSATWANKATPLGLSGKPPEEIFNWMRTGLSDDANRFVDEAAKAVGVTRPTRVTHREVLADLQEMGFKSRDIDWITNYSDNTQMMRKVAMAREAMTSTANLWQRLATELTVNPSPELAVKFHQTGVLLGQLTRGVKNVQTDTARALGIMRANPAGDAAALESFIGEAGGMDNVISLAGKVAKMDLANPLNVKRAADLADKSMFSKLKDVWITTWINGILSSPVTHAKNTLGNELFSAIQVPERFIGSLIGHARGAEDAIEMAESVALLRGMVAGQTKAFQAAAKAFVENRPVTTQATKLTDTGGTISDFGDYLGIGGQTGRALNLYGKAVTLPGRTLMSEDEYFKVQGYFMELYAASSRAGSAARREAIAAGKSADEAAKIESQVAMNVLESPPPEIDAAAWNMARYLTFTDPLEHGTVGKKFQDMAGSNVVARTFMPFTRTPINIAAATLERTPFAPFTRSFQQAWTAGGIERDMALARVALGTSMLTTAGYLSSIGRITGSGPGDPGQREALLRSGWQPYSMVFYKDEVNASTRKLLSEQGRLTETNDKVFWTFAGLEPIGGLLSMGANYAEYARWNDNVNEVEQVAYGMAFGLAGYMMELPYLQGMASAVQMFTGGESGRITPDTVKNFVTGLTKQLTSVAIGGSPAGVASSAQAVAERYMDPVATDTRVLKNMDPALRGVMEAFNRYRSRVPGLSRDLPPLTNRWGEVVAYGEGALYETVSPIRVKEGSQKAVDKLWLEYDLPRAQPSRLISWPERPDMAGIRVELTAEQFNDLKRVYAWEIKDDAGMNVQDALVAVTRDPAFKKMAFGAQQQYLNKVDSAFMSAARTKFVNESRFAPMLQAEFERKKLSADAYGIYSDELR